MKTYKPGEVILGKYKVTRILGQGGMGQVLAAHRPDLNDTVALKFLLASVHDKPEIAARFAREARTAIRIENEHVCRVYDVGEVEGVPFIVMEHLEGEDLDAVLEARGGLPAQEAADLLLQGCEAIHEAHVVHGIVHRDLKPGNLFVKTRLDGRPFVKVLDFGIAKSSAAGDMSATASTTVLGSPLYMSPEQLLTPKNVDARSDVWALGVILYEMLTGAPPFTGDTQPAVMAAVLKGSYAKATTLRSDIPADLEQLLAETLVVDPGARLPSVEAFAARLAPFGTGAAATSYDHIQRLSRSLPSSRPAPPAESVTPPPTEVSAPKGAGRVTEDTTALAVPQSTPDPPAKAKASRVRWSAAALGLAVAGVGAVAVLPRMRHAGGPTDVDPAPSSVASSVDTVQADSASPAASGVPGETTAQKDNVSGDPPASTTVAAPARDNVGTTAHPNATGSTSGEASRTPGTSAPAASVGACAAGATAACEAACTGRGGAPLAEAAICPADGNSGVRRRCAQHGGAFRGDFVRKAAAVRVRRLVRSGQNGASFAYAPSIPTSCSRSGRSTRRAPGRRRRMARRRRSSGSRASTTSRSRRWTRSSYESGGSRSSRGIRGTIRRRARAETRAAFGDDRSAETPTADPRP